MGDEADDEKPLEEDLPPPAALLAAVVVVHDWFELNRRTSTTFTVPFRSVTANSPDWGDQEMSDAEPPAARSNRPMPFWGEADRTSHSLTDASVAVVHSRDSWTGWNRTRSTGPLCPDRVRISRAVLLAADDPSANVNNRVIRSDDAMARQLPLALHETLREYNWRLPPHSNAFEDSSFNIVLICKVVRCLLVFDLGVLVACDCDDFEDKHPKSFR